MKFQIRKYPEARWDDELETHVLGAPGDIVREIDADYPQLALNETYPLVDETGIESEERWVTVRGKRVRRTAKTYRGTSEAMAAWMTADGMLALTAVPS